MTWKELAISAVGGAVIGGAVQYLFSPHVATAIVSNVHHGMTAAPPVPAHAPVSTVNVTPPVGHVTVTHAAPVNPVADQFKNALAHADADIAAGNVHGLAELRNIVTAAVHTHTAAGMQYASTVSQHALAQMHNLTAHGHHIRTALQQVTERNASYVAAKLAALKVG